MPLMDLPLKESEVQCPCCGRQDYTRTEKTCGQAAWLYGAGLALTTCVLCVLPIWCTCKDRVHFCRGCGQAIGKFEYPIF